MPRIHFFTISLLACGALALAAGGAATAGGGCNGNSVVQHIFDEADGDGSGALSPDEYAEAGLERFGVPFEASDLDGDGETTFDEYLELYEAHHPPGGGAEV